MHTEQQPPLNPSLQRFDPRYVQVSRKEAAAIIGRSPTEFDRMRKRDPRCPKGHKMGQGIAARVMFRLSEVYQYSETLIQDAEALENNELTK
jgi:hypothetical protein